MTKTIGIFIIVLVLNCLFIDDVWLYHNLNRMQVDRNTYQVHRIRHQRHLTKKFVYPLRSSEYNQRCSNKIMESNPTTLIENCPPRSCTTNQECWEPFGPSKLCICDPHLCGRVCMEDDVRCPIPKHPVNGKVHYTRLVVGDHVEYTCRPKYVVKGPRKRYCQANQRLSGHEPECTDQTDWCFSAPYIPNTHVGNDSSREDFRNGERVNIYCQNGFEDSENPYTTAYCDGNEWKYQPINCRRKRCDKLDDPLHGRTMSNENVTFQSIAIQFCNDGYRIKCNETDTAEEKNCKRVCEANGLWSGDTAICIAILCPELKALANGTIIGLWNTVNSIKTFKCNEGFELSGSYLRKCRKDGKWDGPEATCNVRDCGPPPKIPNANVSFGATIHNSKATYRCKQGSALFGPSKTLTCGEVNAKSAWLPKPEPQCLQHCQSIFVNNAQESSQTSDDTVHRHNSTIKIICNQGFELSRQEMPKCENGNWSYMPQCLEASCSRRPPSMKYSTVRFYSLKHNSPARYYCHPGYRIHYRENGHIKYRNSYDVYCLKGNWTKMPNEGCQPTKCSKPPTLANGEIYLLGQSDRTRLTDELIKPVHNRVVKYECHSDYRLKGPKIAVCLNGQWSPPESPNCEFIMHDELPLSWLYYQSSDNQ